MPLCPEQLGGLPTPRTPAERIEDRVMTKDGRDVTAEYRHGAEQALHLARLCGCKIALLKERSPSCGSGTIYDGTFIGGLTAGEKAAVAYVFAQKHGVQGLTMTFDELREEGYLTGEKLEGGSTAYSFTNGLLFTITPEETQDNGASVCFSAEKWRSPLGAYYFTKCTASRGDNGWEYTVGAEAIS